MIWIACDADVREKLSPVLCTGHIPKRKDSYYSGNKAPSNTVMDMFLWNLHTIPYWLLCLLYHPCNFHFKLKASLPCCMYELRVLF